MKQSGLKSYYLAPEEIENLLQSQYGSSIQPIDYTRLRAVKIQQARTASFAASYKN